MGYQQNAVNKGYKMVTPVFENVDKSEFSVNDLVCVGAADNDAYIQTMNASGEWTGMYAWNEAYEEWPAGWYDDNGDLATTTLKPGDSVFFQATADKVTLQSAGAVSSVITRTLGKGYSMIGNCTPVAIDVNSVKVVDGEDNVAYIQTMNADGEWTGMYAWNEAYEEWPAGWYDDNGDIADVTLAPGESVFFQATADTVKVSIPSAL